MSDAELLIVIEGEPIGRVHEDRRGQLTLDYAEAWRQSPNGYPLSVSMPLADVVYRQKNVRPYLWNLLPENENVLSRWAQQYQTSAGNPFRLLRHVGADLPGAAQLIPSERLEEIQTAKAPTIQWISDHELKDRLRLLREDFAATRLPGDIGKMSLPGVQAKTALYWDTAARRWGVPGGRAPTSHILKPCIPGFPGLVENEYLCQTIAARLGLPAAHSHVLDLDEPIIVVERYDRLPPPPGSQFMQRIHQEDLCQALSLMPARKYQEEGGPGIVQIVKLIRTVSSAIDEDIERFLQANMFNWLIGGTDAHAKNYSLLIAALHEVRLAPLYDLSTQLPYSDRIARKVAMKIGDHYEITRIGLDDWRRLARACGLEEERVIGVVTQLAQALPDHIADAGDQALAEGLAEKFVTPLAEQLIAHVQERTAVLTTRRA